MLPQFLIMSERKGKGSLSDTWQTMNGSICNGFAIIELSFNIVE